MRSAPAYARSNETNYDVAIDNTDAHESLPTVLLLVNIEQSISKLSSELDKAVSVEGVLNHLLDECTCATPNDLVSGVTLDKIQQARNDVEKSIMRFRREQDRWTAIVSVLLKSVAFHRLSQGLPSDISTEPVASNAKSGMRPIVILPRTKFNRPYIPHTSTPLEDVREAIGSDNANEANEHPNAKISVSHQYPHIAIVQSSSCSKIGMDVVLFEFRKSEFTPTTNSFLQSFETSFTQWEWEQIQYSCKGGLFRRQIQRDDDSKLREFFLRWAIKESYTKALGLGMHVEFSSFETRLMGIDKMGMNVDTHESIWSFIMSATNNGERVDGTASKSTHESTKRSIIQTTESLSQYSVFGQVVHADISEIFKFIFVPLSSDDASGYEGCCCICTIPFSPCNNREPDDPGASETPISIENIKLSDLIKSHKEH